MTRYLYDALYPAGIPLTIEPDAIVASYVDHPEVVPPCMVQLAARFPLHVNVSIAAHNGDAQIADIERFAMSTDDLPGWTVRQRNRGIVPAYYAAPGTVGAAQQACAAHNVPIPLWWAVQRAAQPFIPAGAVGNQWLGAGPYDKSIITDEWALILDPPPPAEESDVLVFWSLTADGVNIPWLILGAGKVELDGPTVTLLRAAAGYVEVTGVTATVINSIPTLQPNATHPTLSGTGTFNFASPATS